MADNDELVREDGELSAHQKWPLMYCCFASKALVKSVIKDRRNKTTGIEMFFKELEKGRGIVCKHIPAVRKGIF